MSFITFSLPRLKNESDKSRTPLKSSDFFCPLNYSRFEGRRRFRNDPDGTSSAGD